MDFTLDTVTDEILNMHFEGNLSGQVLLAGTMPSTGNPLQDAVNAKKHKNHFSYFANVCLVGASSCHQMVYWAMNIVDPAAHSDKAQYHNSNDGSNLGSSSDFEAKGKSSTVSSIILIVLLCLQALLWQELCFLLPGQ